jgi:hypothetical protein
MLSAKDKIMSDSQGLQAHCSIFIKGDEIV